MEESEDNMSSEDIKFEDGTLGIKIKPKKRSLVERELETNLTARVTSPITNGDSSSTSRYGRARRLKTESEYCDIDKLAVRTLKSPKLDKSPNRITSPVYKMHASNSPVKVETPKRQENNLENQIESIYCENISLSRFGSEEKKCKSETKKFPKVYIRKDLIQSKDKDDDTLVLIKNMFSPVSSSNKSKSFISQQSSEKCNSTTKNPQNGYLNTSSVVKTLDFDGTKKKKKEGEKKLVMSKSDLFDLEAKCTYQVGDLTWARMGTYPFWPCIVTRDPLSGMFVKKKLFGRIERDVVHVTFFGDNGRRGWIVDSMLRKFLGQLEFESTRHNFTPEGKKKDPRLYAAFFVSEKKMPQWQLSVEEAETLLREPKRLRIDILNEMLQKTKIIKTTPKHEKSKKISRTDSDVSLSESLYDTLFSEDDSKANDSERSRSKSRNRSLDVSEVVTACLDNMAAKTGITKIQRQSHMDRWLQKAKSKTPEKSRLKSHKKDKVNKKVKTIKSPKENHTQPQSFSHRKSKNESQLNDCKLKSHHNDHDYSQRLRVNAPTILDDVEIVYENAEILHIESVESGSGIGIIAKVETLCDKEQSSSNETVEIITTVVNDEIDVIDDMTSVQTFNDDINNISNNNDQIVKSTQEIKISDLPENDVVNDHYVKNVKSVQETDINDVIKNTDDKSMSKNQNLAVTESDEIESTQLVITENLEILTDNDSDKENNAVILDIRESNLVLTNFADVIEENEDLIMETSSSDQAHLDGSKANKNKNDAFVIQQDESEMSVDEDEVIKDKEILNKEVQEETNMAKTNDKSHPAEVVNDVEDKSTNKDQGGTMNELQNEITLNSEILESSNKNLQIVQNGAISESDKDCREENKKSADLSNTELVPDLLENEVTPPESNIVEKVVLNGYHDETDNTEKLVEENIYQVKSIDSSKNTQKSPKSRKFKLSLNKSNDIIDVNNKAQILSTKIDSTSNIDNMTNVSKTLPLESVNKPIIDINITSINKPSLIDIDSNPIGIKVSISDSIDKGEITDLTHGNDLMKIDPPKENESFLTNGFPEENSFKDNNTGKIDKTTDLHSNKIEETLPNSESTSLNEESEKMLVDNFEDDDINSIDDNDEPLSAYRLRLKSSSRQSNSVPIEKDAKTDKEIDPDTISINSEDSEVSLSKRKIRKDKLALDKRKPLEDPEFLKYLELRQDAVMDEHPELSQEEIANYLYKTWLYEENLKTDIKKTDDIDQANLVKGLNQEPVPVKKIRKKIKTDIVKEPKLVLNDIIPKEKSKRKIIRPYYKEEFSDAEEDVAYFEIFNTNRKGVKPNQTTKESTSVQGGELMKEGIISNTNNDGYMDVESEYNNDETDEVESYFQQLTAPKPNVFKGLVREKVCEICEKVGNLVKCKGCHGMFHVDCVKKQTEVVESPVPVRGRKKKKKNRGRKPKDDNGVDSGSDEKSQDANISDEILNTSMDDIESHIVANADEFEAQLSAKMKEMLDNPEIKDKDEYSSDEELDWNDIEFGQCKIVDIKPKKRNLDSLDFKCNDCHLNETPICFVCKSAVSPKDKLDHRQKCQVAHCNKYYHLECLDHWPQTQFTGGEWSKSSKNEFFEAISCPRHVCHTCVCDDPRGCKTRFSGDKLARCIKCPATYHAFTKCLPAGTKILTASHIICPRHYEHRPGKVPCHVNTGWCFICALGGSLICCEYCPTSFHAECLNIKPPEGGYMCEDCETGRLPLYGEMVWVKLGHYRWWPGIILHPSEIPANILAVKHTQGEFVVRFFGQYDYYWVNRGRVFPFQEGDSGKVSSQKSKIDAAFTMAMEHAQRACEILKTATPNEEESLDIASSLLPPHYVKLKVNKPCGSLCGKKIDIEESSLTQCECDPNDVDPCGPYTQCLNRMLLTECGPTCRAGDRCNNRAFEKRLYPKMVPYRTPHRGWGLKTLDFIRAGQFVIEYVGELIDEEEFQRRMRRKHEVRDENFYFLTLDKERMIDAGPKGNLARFMNHSCEPNCETQKWTVLGDIRVGLFAIYDIPANSELTFNYNLESTGIEKKQCMCGAKRCSGYIGAKPKQDEQSKKNKAITKRTYKKRKTIEDSPSTSRNTKPKQRVGRPMKPRELTEIEKDLLIIKNATNGLSSDSEGSGRLSSIDSSKDSKALKRKRTNLSIEENSSNGVMPQNIKKLKLEEKTIDIGD